MSINKYKNRLLTRKEYYQCLKDIESLPAEYCTFCEDQKSLTIKEFQYWNLLFCKAPYWKYHLLLVPKRHFKEFSDMNNHEQDEFNKVLRYTLTSLQSANLRYNDGQPVEMFLFFWRIRDRNYDPVGKVRKTDHFHLHIVPEKEHMWEPILDKEAWDIDMELLRNVFSS